MKNLLYAFKESLFDKYSSVICNIKISDFVFHNDWLIFLSDNGLCSFLLIFDKSIHKKLTSVCKSLIGLNIVDCFDIADEYEDNVCQVLYVCLIDVISSFFNKNSELERRNIFYSTEKLDIARFIPENSKVLLFGFGGIASTLAKTGCELFITDKREESEFEDKLSELRKINSDISFVTVENQFEYIKNCSHFVITGSILTNSGLKTILDNAPHDSFKMMYGPSASLMPDLLFDIGIDVILTYRVSDIDTFLYELKNSDEDIERILKKSQQKIVYCKINSN